MAKYSDAFALRNDKAGEVIAERMRKRNFQAWYCKTAEEARDKAISLIGKEDTITFGGSYTAEQIGLLSALKEGGYKVFDRKEARTPEEKEAIVRKAFSSDVFITSFNAFTEDGQLINIDGNGNRVAAIAYGPKSVIAVIGMNKLTKNVDDAFDRAQTIAAPVNAQRLELKSGCAKTGICCDCLAVDTACCYYQRIRACRPAGKIKVILIGEDLGF